MDGSGRVFLCKEEEIEPGRIHHFMVSNNRPLALVRTADDNYYALHGLCPHHGAPLWKGQLTWLACSEKSGDNCGSRPGEILRCPWHGFEYDLKTGRSVVEPEKLRVKTYEIVVEEGRVFAKG